MQNILPEILRCLVSWVSKVLCLIPDSSSSWGLSHVRTWCMHKNPFHSCSYPSGHWSAMNTPGLYLSIWSSSLSAAKSSVSVRGRAGSPLWLFLFSFYCQSNTSVGGRAGSLLPLCLGTYTDRVWFMCCCMLLVQPLLSSAGYRYKYGRMYKCGGLCWVSMDMQVRSCSLATMVSGGLDLDARGLDLGSYTTPTHSNVSISCWTQL